MESNTTATKIRISSSFIMLLRENGFGIFWRQMDQTSIPRKRFPGRVYLSIDAPLAVALPNTVGAGFGKGGAEINK